MSLETLPSPGLGTFKTLLPSWPVERSIEYLVSLFKRRQIRGSRPCALATAWLLRKVVSTTKAREPGKLITRVQEVGKKLVDASPRELTIGNIVRRVLGAIREEDDNRTAETPTSSEVGSISPTPRGEHSSAPLATLNLGSRGHGDQTSGHSALVSAQNPILDRKPQVTSMFSILSHPTMRGSGTASPIRSGTSTPLHTGQHTVADFGAEILEAITEIIDELDQADEQIAGYALEHVSPQETIFTYSSSSTVQKFLLKAASRRKFTVIHAEAYPNNYRKSHSMVTGKASIADDEDLDSESFQKPLISAGITVILVPDSAVFALMSRANKVIISAQGVLSNGSIVAAAGSTSLIRAARFHRVPVLVLAATYKLSPLYPYNPYEFIEYGDTAKVVPYQDRELSLGLQNIRNPVSDFIEAENVDLFVTNLGGFATGYLYRVTKDQYRDEDIIL